MGNNEVTLYYFISSFKKVEKTLTCEECRDLSGFTFFSVVRAYFEHIKSTIITYNFTPFSQIVLTDLL